MIWVHLDMSFETQYLLEEIWYKQIGEGLAEEYFLALKIIREGSKLIPVTPTAIILLEVWFPFVNSSISFVAVDVPI